MKKSKVGSINLEFDEDMMMMNMNRAAIPVSALLSTIGEILVKGTGEEFDLEIYERPLYNETGKKRVTITLSFNIPPETEEKKTLDLRQKAAE